MTFDVNRIKECFPFPEFRESQKEVTGDIINAFNSGVDVYLLNASVGFGKSPIGIALSRMTSERDEFDSDAVFGAYYSTPQKVLQDQLGNDFSDYIDIIKGRSTYKCSVIPGNSCANGMCQFDDKFECDMYCPYIDARNEAINGQIVCSNLAYLLVVPEFMFGKRELLIIDEAHSISDWALGFVSCTIKAYDVDDSIPRFNNYYEYIDWLKEIHIILSKKFDSMCMRVDGSGGSGKFAIGLKEAKDNVAEVLARIEFLLDDYESTKEEWVFQINDKGTKKEAIKFEPITAGRFLDKIIWWRGEKKLLMSGTIFAELFVEEAGLTDVVCEYKEVPSIFPVEHRPVYYWPAGKMTKYERENTIPHLIERAFVIKQKYPESKGIMHCGSYKIAEDVFDGLRKLCGDGVQLQDRNDRAGSLQKWMDSDEPSLFLSVNMTEGIDLKDELCRYQIIAKIQFPYLGDERVKSRMNMVKYKCSACGKVFRTVRDIEGSKCTCDEGILSVDMDVYVYTCSECGKKLISGVDELITSDTCTCGNKFTKTIVTIDGKYHYDAQAIIDLVQAYGRVVRTPEDFADTWITDASFLPLYRKRYTVFPKMFKEAVKVIK